MSYLLRPFSKCGPAAAWPASAERSSRGALSGTLPKESGSLKRRNWVGVTQQDTLAEPAALLVLTMCAEPASQRPLHQPLSQSSNNTNCYTCVLCVRSPNCFQANAHKCIVQKLSKQKKKTPTSMPVTLSRTCVLANACHLLRLL